MSELLLGDGRVPHTPMEFAQAKTERMYQDEDSRLPLAHSTDANKMRLAHQFRQQRQLEWTGKIDQAIAKHGSWFHDRVYWTFSWKDDPSWYFYLAKSAEPTVMDVPNPDGDTCYVTERIEPIEHKIVGTDPDAVGQEAIEFIGKLELPIQNVPMPMERIVREGLHGMAYLDCRCKLNYGIALREFVRFNPAGPWVSRRKEPVLLGHPMQQLHGTTQ